MQLGPTSFTYASYDELIEAYRDKAGIMEKTVWLDENKPVRLMLPAKPPKVLISTLKADGEGRLVQYPMRWPFLVRVETAAKFTGMSESTIKRLCAAGFVSASTVCPQVKYVDMESLLAHIEQCTGEDGHLFWTKERAQRLRLTRRQRWNWELEREATSRRHATARKLHKAVPLIGTQLEFPFALTPQDA